MTKTEMKKKVAALACKMDNQWYAIQKEEEIDSGSEIVWEMKKYYYAIIETISVLGGQFSRDNNGEHKVFLLGVSATAEDI